jgi:glycosyltransferase involved in cell wall biosynthesis
MSEAHIPLPLLSVVIPVLDEAPGLRELHERLTANLDEIPGEHEIVYVDDGSSDGSSELIADWARSQPGVMLVKLSRNFGMDIAMSAGLDHARGDYVAVIHADLQDPPELLGEMLATAQGGADVVYARRIGREESAIKRGLATAFYALMQRMARVPYQGQAGDFRLMRRRVVDAVRRMPERRRFLRGMVAWVGFRQVPIEYRRAGRSSGRGATYPELLRLALEALASFSDVPLNFATFFGLVTAVISGLGGLVILILTLTGTVAASVSVWVLVTVLFLGGVQLISVGILGRYLARVHEEALRRPLYMVDDVIGGPDVGPADLITRPRT